MPNTFSVTQFTGGMNEWISPGLLNANCAVKLVNADESTGKLVPIEKPTKEPYDDPVYYGHYGNQNRNVIKWNERTYWSQNDAQQAPYYGGAEENYLGIPYPAYKGEKKNVDISGGTATGTETGLNGSYKYCVTFLDADQWEGAPGALDDYEVAIELADKVGVVTVTWPESIVAKAKIYRTISHGADFYCVGEVSKESGSTSATFRDTVPDTDAQMMNPLTTQYNYPPPDRGKFLTEYGGVFFLAVDGALYFSTVGNPHAWPTTQFLSFDDTITGIAPEFEGILVFTAGKVFKVTGAYSESTITKSYIPGNHGCVSYRTISALNNAPVWLSYDGICLWDGSNITVPSYRVIHAENLAPKYGVAVKDKYFLSLNDHMIVYDLKNGGIFYVVNLVFDYGWYNEATDRFYFLSGSGLYSFGGGGNMEITYLSPDIGGTDILIHIAKEALVSCSGKCVFEFIVDGKTHTTVTLPASGRHRIKLPLDATGQNFSVKLKSNSPISELVVIYD